MNSYYDSEYGEEDYYTDYMGENVRPSLPLLLLTFIPLIFEAITFFVTNGFSVHPTFPPIVYAIGTLMILVIAIVLSVFAFMLSKDEEPEWGSKLPFKIIQALNLSSIVISLVFIIMIVFVYYLKV